MGNENMAGESDGEGSTEPSDVLDRLRACISVPGPAEGPAADDISGLFREYVGASDGYVSRRRSDLRLRRPLPGDPAPPWPI